MRGIWIVLGFALMAPAVVACDDPHVDCEAPEQETCKRDGSNGEPCVCTCGLPCDRDTPCDQGTCYIEGDIDTDPGTCVSGDFPISDTCVVIEQGPFG